MTNNINFSAKRITSVGFFLLTFILSSFNAVAQCGSVLPALVSSGTTTFSGNMTLNTTMTITGAGTVVNFTNLTLGANSTLRQIIVTAGATLNINQASVLGVCPPTLSWVGVRVNANSTVNMSNSTIMNATTGINIVNGLTPANFNIINSNFTNNVTGLLSNAFNGAHPGTLSNSTFAGTGTGTGVRINGPMAGTMSLTTLSQNSFLSLTTGMNLLNSVVVSVLNCTFANLTTGITATNALANPTGVLDVLVSNFTSCTSFGVTVNGDINHQNNQNKYTSFPVGSTCIRVINQNTNNDMITNNGFGNYDDGVLVQSFTGTNVNISGNNFRDNPNGVSISGVTNTASPVSIFNNVFSNNLGDGKTAISLVNTTGAGPANISQNFIHDFENGIVCTNLMAAPIVQADNQIYWMNPSNIIAHYGIKNTTCATVSTNNNSVFMNSATITSFTGIYNRNIGALNVGCNHVLNGTAISATRIGYDFSMTLPSFTTCNVTDNEDAGMNIGFRFTATPVGTYPVVFTGNRMFNDVTAGLRLTGWGIGTQGSPTAACWNRWWACGIVRAGGTPINIFYISTPSFPQETAVPAAGCIFTLSSMPSFLTSGVSNYVSPCTPPISFKNMKENLDAPIAIDMPSVEAPKIISTTPNEALEDRFYPNPVANTAFYEVEMPESTKGTIQLMDVSGRSLSQKDLQIGANKVEFDLSEIPNGMYLYKVTMNNSITKVGKFVVQH